MQNMEYRSATFETKFQCTMRMYTLQATGLRKLQYVLFTWTV